MDPGEFARRYPTLYQMADGAAWPSLLRHGLLSAKATVDLYDPPEDKRAAILSRQRKTSILLNRADLGSMVIRDQKPLKYLAECLDQGVSAQDFLDALNGSVLLGDGRAASEIAEGIPASVQLGHLR
jgi:hypothetical protein